jgi:glycosyltransferase involved in cell wall biosynthesis
VPLLATSLPVIAEVVEGAGIGLLVRPDDPDSVATGLRSILEPATHARLRAATTTFAEANTWEIESRALAAVYRELTEPGQRRQNRSGRSARVQRLRTIPRKS